MESDQSHRFLQGARHALLTAEQELAHGRLIQSWLNHPNGHENAPDHIKQLGKKALDNLVNCNRRLAINIVNRYTYSSYCRDLETADLYQEAFCGLLTAAKKFDPDRKLRFSTLATFWIKQAINRHLHKARGLISIPVHNSERIARIKRYAQDYFTVNGKQPTVAEITEATGISATHIEKLKSLNVLQQSASADVILQTSKNGANSNEGESLLDNFGSEDGEYFGTQNSTLTIDTLIATEDEQKARSEITKLLQQLSTDQKLVVIHRAGLFGEEEKSIEETSRLLSKLFPHKAFTKTVVKALYASSLKKLENAVKPAQIKSNRRKIA